MFLSADRLLGRCLALLRRFRWILPCLAIPLAAWVHARAGFTYPAPWPDEAVFVWPAMSFQETGSLQTDIMNPDRPIWWHPPGYQWALGLVFRILEPGLESARWASWFWMACAYLALLKITDRFTARGESAFILTLVYLSQHATIAGNTARPEALVILAASAAFLLLARGYPWLALSVLGMSVVCHPVGVFFGAGAVATVLLRYGIRWPFPKRGEWIGLSVSVLVVGVTAAILVVNREHVAHDLAFAANFIHMTWADRMVHLAEPRNAIPAVLFLLIAVDAFWRRSHEHRALAMFGLVSWSLEIVRPEMWYTTYTAMAYASFAVLLADMIIHRVQESGGGAKAFVPAVVVATIVAGCFLRGFVADPRHYPRYMWWQHMTIRDDIPYLTDDDVAEISRRLVAELGPGPDTRRVSFVPAGDGVLFTRKLPMGITPFYPVFTPVKPDAFVVRLSRLTYPGFTKQATDALTSLGVGVADADYVRDETEKWYIVPGE